MNNYLLQDFFKKVSDYFEGETNKAGVLICPKHRVEHTAKNSYAAMIDIQLHQLTGEQKYFDRAKKRIQRTIKNLIRDPDFGYWIFYPGRLGRWNMANSVNDCGACLDALTTFYSAYSTILDIKEKEAIKDAIYKNSDTYLKNAVVEKEIINQRLWGASGLAKAYSVFREERWREALIVSLKKSLGEMWPDGTFPYHSHFGDYKIFKGIYDTTAFYHSRCVAFIYYILDNIGEPLDNYRESLIRATDLLVAMYQPAGLKSINLESKRWYWNSSYEVASHPFDIYALIKTYELTKKDIYAYYARKSLEQLLRHQVADGGIASHLNEPQTNFQCRVFWNSNLAWLARVIKEAAALPEVGGIKEFQYFSDSGLFKFKNENYSCLIRGRKQPMSLMLGPAVGGGSLLYFGRKDGDWANVLWPKAWAQDIPANFSFRVKESRIQNLKRVFAANKREIKTKAYHALIELRAPNFKSFMSLCLTLAKMIITSSAPVFASQWSCFPETFLSPDRLIFKIAPAKRDGRELAGAKLEREFLFKENNVLIRERLSLDNQKIKKVRYNKPKTAYDLKISAGLSYNEGKENIVFRVNKPQAIIEISYIF